MAQNWDVPTQPLLCRTGGKCMQFERMVWICMTFNNTHSIHTNQPVHAGPRISDRPRARLQTRTASTLKEVPIQHGFGFYNFINNFYFYLI